MDVIEQAFSSVELSEAKQRISRLHDLQVQVDATWRGSRWIMDALSLARERTATVGVAIGALSQPQSQPSASSAVQPLSTPAEAAEEAYSRALAAPVRTNKHRDRERVLLKAKSDHKILCNSAPADALLRTQVPKLINELFLKNLRIKKKLKKNKKKKIKKIK